MVVEDIKKANEILTSHMKTLIELEGKNYRDGEDNLDVVDRQIKIFINRVFPDNKERLQDYSNTVYRISMAIVGYEETEMEKQKNYLEKIKSMKLFVQGLIYELEIYGMKKEKVGPPKTETEREIRGGIPGFLAGKWRDKKIN